MKAKKCRVHWIRGKFGWDAVAFADTRVFNTINYGLKKKPTKAQQTAAAKALCGKNWRSALPKSWQ